MNKKSSCFDESTLRKRSGELIDQKQFEEDNPNCGVSYEQYTLLISQFDIKFAEFINAESLEQLMEIFHYFNGILSFSNYPQKIKTDEFILAIFTQIQKFPTDQTLAEFSKILATIYNTKKLNPPMQILELVVQMLTTNINPPLNEFTIKVAINFLLFLSKYCSLIPKEIFVNFQKFLNITPHLTSSLLYFYSKLLKAIFQDTDYVEIVQNFPPIIENIYETVLPQVIATVKTDEFSIEILVNLTELIQEFVSDDKEFGLYSTESYFQSIFLPLSSLWNASDEVNENLFLILTLLSEEFKHFTDKQAFLDLLQAFLDEGGLDIIMSLMTESVSYTHRILHLLKYLIRFNFMNGAHFVFTNDEEFIQIYKRILYFCLNGTLLERIYAGKCFAEIIKRSPTLGLENFLLEGQGDLDLSPEILQDCDVIASKPCLVLQILVALHDESLAKTIIRTLYYISEKAYAIGRIHEFRETCDLYQVDQMILDVASDFPDLDNLVAKFNSTAFGPLPYNEE